jgi:type I restriction enzyme S subunit
VSEWIEHRLGEVCSRLRSGSNITAKDIHETGSFPVFGGNGIRGYAAEANFSGECAIIGRQGAYCGNVRYFIGEARMSEHAIVACAGPSHHTRFLAYLLSTMNLGSLSGQAAQPGLSVKVLAQQSVRMPSRQNQERIAEILGAYDDLIEVNRRRVAALEEITQGLFEEWFVRFRFPGHEAVPMVDKPEGLLPEGWRWSSLGELADIQWGDTSTTKKAYVPQGYTAFSASGADGYMAHFDYDRVGVVLSAIGAKCGKTWLARGQWSCIKNTMRFWSKSEGVSTEFLYLATSEPDQWPKRGAAQPFISLGDAKKIPLVKPERSVSERFGLIASNTLEMVSNLTEQNTVLATSRDLLLPRLISGQLSVTAATRELEDAA